MTEPSLVVRPATQDELEEHFKRSQETFAPDAAPDFHRKWQSNLTNAPEYRPEQIRVAILDGKQVGGYIVYERLLRIGEARLMTGCIGVVATDPAYRKQKIATALMQDAISYAHAHQYPLLLLDGIPKFYYRYGYTDVFDLTTYEINAQAVLALPPGPYMVRVATLDDAASLVELYNRHYGPYTGSFVRSVEKQAHQLQNRRVQDSPLLAIDENRQLCGYLSLGDERSQARELVAENWEALSTLLQYQARLLDSSDTSKILTCWLPPTMPILDLLIDHLEVPDTSQWPDALYAWSVRGSSYHHRHAAWMGRCVDLSALKQAMLPEWQTRWQRSLADWSGDVQLAIGTEIFTLRITQHQLQLIDHTPLSATTIHLTPQQFVQIIFGYRSIHRALQQPVTQEMQTVLHILFPAGNTWIPTSDWF